MKKMTKKLYSISLLAAFSFAVGVWLNIYDAMPTRYAAADNEVTLSLATETPSDYELTLGADYDIGATIIGTGISSNSTISVVITNGMGETEFSLAELPDSYIYHFENTGAYELVYTVMDDGTTLYTEQVDINVKRSYYRLNNIAFENIVSFGDENAVRVSQNSVYIFDVAYGANFYDVTESNISVVMKVKKPNASEYVELTQVQKEQGYVFEETFGKYDFTYDASYEVGGETYSISGVSFSVELVDGTNPTLYLVGETYLKNAAYLSDSVDGKTTYYKALVNQPLTFGKLLARDEVGDRDDLTSDISWSIYCDGESKLPLTLCGNTEMLSYTPDTCGEYIFAFIVVDDFGNRDFHYLVVQVNEYLYELVFDYSLKETYVTGEQLVFNGFTVVNHAVENVYDVTKKIVIYSDEEILAVLNDGKGNFTFQTSGNYTVVYQALKNDEIICEESNLLNVEDKTSPSIVLSGEVGKRGVVGESIKLPTVECTDNETTATYDITIMLGEQRINYYKGAFKPATAGTYIVTISASDLNGNSTTYSYEVTVVESGNGCTSTLGTSGVVSGTLIFALVAIFKKNNFKIKGRKRL